MAIINKTIWGRDLTEAEISTIGTYIAGLPAGETDGITYIGEQSDKRQIFVRIWSTTEAANSFVALQNTFSPAPLSTQVL